MEKWNPLERKLPRLFEGLKFLPSLIHGDLCTINIGEADNEIGFLITNYDIKKK